MIKIGTHFSGIGSPEAALRYLGLPHKSIFACEIDKYARASFNEMHHTERMIEDVTSADWSSYEPLDLYVAGFPCQAFSTAGKRLGFNEASGTLFFNVAEFIKVNQPKAFILENVKGLVNHDAGKTFTTIIDILSNGGGTVNGQISIDNIDGGLGYHIYYKVLNTKDYGIPQNRERIFIVGFKDFRSFRFPKAIPLDIKLKDILDDQVDNKYYLSDKMIASFTKHKERHEDKGTGFKWQPKDGNDVANCLRANAALAATDNSIITHSLYPRSSKTGKGGSGHLSKSDGTSYCLDTGNAQAIEYSAKIRRLTPLECFRLQGFKDEDFYKAQKVNSDTQLYKQAGNSITVDVMMALINKIYA